MFADDYDHRRLNTLSWIRYAAALSDDPVLLLPVGSHEQHGPHLPMGCDAILADAMAVRLAEKLDGLVLPVLSYGYKSQARSGGGEHIPGTISLDGASLTLQVRDILRGIFYHGVRKIVVLNGHAENQWFLTEAIDLALREALPARPDLHLIRCEYWKYTPQSTLEAVFEGLSPRLNPHYVALLETSMMLALKPDLVDMSAMPSDRSGQFPPHDAYPQTGEGVPPSGVLSPVSGASAKKGRRLIRDTVAAMAAGLGEALNE
ncbi:creatininase [Granulosicoccaceae sp. 1_MG-2023]|nr:creatininase [Granulosicoccaceae sp. 1_MG-2023]